MGRIPGRFYAAWARTRRLVSVVIGSGAARRDVSDCIEFGVGMRLGRFTPLEPRVADYSSS